MKNIYDYRIEWKIKGEKNFLDTSIWKHLVYLSREDSKDEVTIIRSFEHLVSLVECIPNASIKTFFGKIYAVKLQGNIYDSKTIFKKRFKPIEIRERYIREDNLSIDNLKSYLKADDFIEYLKDRGITKL